MKALVRAVLAAALLAGVTATPAMAAPAAPPAAPAPNTATAPAGAAPPDAAATPDAAVASDTAIAPDAAARPGPPGGPGTIGAAGAGDPFFPQAGNGGIDVQDYNLVLAYDPNTDVLTGTATLQIRATQDLSRFNLDLRRFNLGTVTVDRVPAAAAQAGQELTITPKRLIRKGSTFTVVVPYSGVPEVVVDPDESIEGFVPTDDGAVVVNEPQGSPGWYPANDTPRDKATYTISMTVPRGLTAVGNGALVSQRQFGGKSTFVWRERFPMSPYLATITLGNFKVYTSNTRSGIPIYIAVDPRLVTASEPVLRRLPEMMTFLENTYGRYPFETVGAIVDKAPNLGYALETQTKPVFDRAPDELTLLHELAHQWYGDAVTLRTWPDIWLNEGFAAWSEWYWTERTSGPPAATTFRDVVAYYDNPEYPERAEFWDLPPADLGEAANLFTNPPYDRGAMTLQSLREKIGDRTFFILMSRWYKENKYGNVSTPEFIALAQRVSGQNLRAFFDAWLFTPGKPSIAPTTAPAAAAVAAAPAPAGAPAAAPAAPAAPVAASSSAGSRRASARR